MRERAWVASCSPGVRMWLCAAEVGRNRADYRHRNTDMCAGWPWMAVLMGVGQQLPGGRRCAVGETNARSSIGCVREYGLGVAVCSSCGVRRALGDGAARVCGRVRVGFFGVLRAVGVES